MQRWRTFLGRLTRQIWFRATLFTAGAVIFVLAAAAVGPTLPADLKLGEDAVQNILQILATSMLAVTTFSLTAMITAFGSVATSTTPRATQLLIADTTSQNALSTFLGSFVFSIVGIIALSTDTFTDQARSILFLGTLLVIALVSITLLRWIAHLTTFGRVPDIIDRVEQAAADASCHHARQPHLGGVAPVEIPRHAEPITASAAGVITGIAIDQLEDFAVDHDATVHVACLPGAEVGRGEPLAYVVRGRPMRDDDAARVRLAFRVEEHRTFEQDPRLGYVALSEIASRALSPAVNDPGTAIEVLNAIDRVMSAMLAEGSEEEPVAPHVHVPRARFADMVEDAFRPIARDGAGMVEVALRLQRVIGHLMRDADDDTRAVLRRVSERAEARTSAALSDAEDAALVAEAARAARHPA
ncbi:DUF2254 domain-containing protein [Demequina sp. NBRC 110057]|uniref:DUF2254 domain-containing protein n=1 Tax=Demequina sp. NBRC 110057 TaxID=1570346 RepID=UPI0013564DF3|nr:DUF2254 domain-containing protein [Demequina sp. NBRC 110057]